MKNLFVIDSNSLVNFARYYVPFDVEGVAVSQLEKLFDDQTLILLQSVQRECIGVAGGIVKKTLPFLSTFRPVERDSELDASRHTVIETRWKLQNVADRMPEEQYQIARERFIRSADPQLIFYAMGNNMTIVTEESKASNDGKPFKKIPLICEGENIPCITLPEMLKEVGILWRPEIQLTATGDGNE